MDGRLLVGVGSTPGGKGAAAGTRFAGLDAYPGRIRTRSNPKVAAVPEPIEVRKIPIKHVSDASGLEELIDSGVIEADRVVAVIGKTEGNGGVNDYTRIIADRAFREVLRAKGSRSSTEVGEVPIVWSGGTDGVLSPHATVFATVSRQAEEPSGSSQSSQTRGESDEPRLTVGFAMSEKLLPEDIGRRPMIEKVAAAVTQAMAKAGITDVADVHYVQTKTPLLTIHTIQDAKRRGQTVWTEHTHESMDLSNGTTALGVAVALGEIKMPADAAVMHDRSLFSAVASCSSGVELDQAQVVVVGNARGIRGRDRIGHGVMTDALDADGIWSAIRDAGLDLPERPHSGDLAGRLVNVFLKCEVSQDGQVRGRRNAMLDDSDVHWHRQIKACVGGVTAVVTGDPAVFVSVSAAHQGPDGGGPVAAIVDLG
jgi:ring-opening amidohydrolase-like protein